VAKASTDYGFDPYNMQTTVWVDGQQTGYWARDFVGFVGGGGGNPSPLAVAVVGEGPDVHRALWEEEANREFPLPTVEPTEPGVINDLLLWAVRHEGVLADGSGARYTILDVQSVRLIETESWAGISEAYYVDWDWDRGHVAPLVFGWNDWEAYEALAEQSDEPMPARLVFELVHTPVGYRIVVVDPAATHFGWPDPD
jgi:hypothetical protein